MEFSRVAASHSTANRLIASLRVVNYLKLSGATKKTCLKTRIRVGCHPTSQPKHCNVIDRLQCPVISFFRFDRAMRHE